MMIGSIVGVVIAIIGAVSFLAALFSFKKSKKASGIIKRKRSARRVHILICG